MAELTIVIDNKDASLIQIQIKTIKGKCYLFDVTELDSKPFSSTILNGKRVESGSQIPLKDFDEIIICNIKFLFREGKS